MFSIVCPTMWRSYELEKMLPLLDSHPVVGEILLINNDVTKTPTWFNRPWRKVKVFSPSSNIFVNPAFNLGIESAQSDKICLLQDDVMFDPNIFGFLNDIVTEDRGCIGVDAKYMITRFPHDLEIFPIQNLTFKPMGDIVFGYAFVMFLHRKNYIPIDEELKIHLGENWICYTHEKKGKQPLVLENFPLTASNMSSTSTLTPFQSYFEKERNAQQWIKNRLDSIMEPK